MENDSIDYPLHEVNRDAGFGVWLIAGWGKPSKKVSCVLSAGVPFNQVTTEIECLGMHGLEENTANH